MKFPLVSGRVLFLVLVLVSAYVTVYAVDCPTCQTSFAVPLQLSVSEIDEVASADFNGDSNPDLVALKSSTNEVLFLAGDGDGNFGTPVSSPVTLSFQRSLTVADFNNDDKLDLAITNFGANSVSILLGNGTGSFTLAATLTVAASPDRVAVADFNNDDKQDLAVLSRGACNSETMTCLPNTITVFSGNGAGQFALVRSSPAGTTRSSDIEAADFNSDGNIDLVFLTSSGTTEGLLALPLGDGTGNFGPINFIPATPFADPAQFSHFTIGDFNGDGKPDIAAARHDMFRIYLGDGHGGFTAIDNPNYGSLDSNLSVADFNADGKLDLLVNNAFSLNSGTSYISLGDGQGHLQLAAPVHDLASGNSVAIGDFDKDGKPDVAVSNGNIRVFLNQTDCSKPVACVLDGDVSVVEGNAGESTVNVTIILSSPSSSPITVDFSTAEYLESFEGLRAQSGIDFKPQSGTITFDPMVTSKTITVSVFGDTTLEADESFRVAITGATGANAVKVPLFVKPPLVRILNDDQPPPVVGISHATVYEGNSGTKQAIFTVTLSAPQSNPITLQYHTEDRTAQSPSDYEEIPAAAPLELTFAPGETTRTIAIPIVGDTVNEADEVFFVKLVTNLAVFFPGRGVGTILNDDAPVNANAPELLTEEGSANAVALDAVLHTAGPFPRSNNNYFGSDKQTRLSLFLRNVNLMPGEDKSIVSVTSRDNDPDSPSGPHTFVVEFIGPVAGTDLTQIIVKVPTSFASHFNQIVVVSVRNVPSNEAILVFR